MIKREINNVDEESAIKDISEAILRGEDVHLGGVTFNLSEFIFGRYSSKQLAFMFQKCFEGKGVVIYNALAECVRGEAVQILEEHREEIMNRKPPIIPAPGEGVDALAPINEVGFNDGYNHHRVRYPNDLAYIQAYGRGYEQQERDIQFTEQMIPEPKEAF